MAIQTVRQDQELTRVEAFLAERGIYPDDAGRYDDQALIDAIRERGLEPTVEVEWSVAVRSLSSLGDEPIEIARAGDRSAALLRALEQAVEWLTPEELWERFDRTAQDMMGISGAEFKRRLEAGELPSDDRAVLHVWMLLPREQ